jgi:molybdopterin-containing oxidoreductase family iron-sulfur binding subunit
MSDDIKLITKQEKTEKMPANFIPLTSLTRAKSVEAVEAKSHLDLKTVREKLALGKGQGYWRSLEELASREDFHDLMQREFPQGAPRDMTPLTRREFVRLMGASLALAGLAGCAFQPAEKILPYSEQPEHIVPGKPLFYATAMTLGGYAIGVLAESHLGRPVKLEGNPQHPASGGATDPWVQASLLDLYDPERSQNVKRLGENSAWDAFAGSLEAALEGQRAKRGAGLRILTETVTSPTLAAQITRLRALYPLAQWHQWEPISRDNVREGARMAFGEVVDTIYDFSGVTRVVSLDSNFLQEEPGRLVYARQFMDTRRAQRVTQSKDKSRFYAIESMPTMTGAVADNRLPLRAGDIEAFTRALAAELGVAGVSGEAPKAGIEGEDAAKWVKAIAADLLEEKKKNRTSIVITGEHQPPVVQALVHAINKELGNVGKTVNYVAPVEVNPINQKESLQNLTSAINAGTVDMLLILSGNPAYNAPADLKFAEALEKLSRNKDKFTAHLGHYFDETARLCQWHVPQAHYLEAWGDARAFNGTISIQQPLIQPLYEAARSPIEVLAALLAPSTSAAIQTLPSGYEIVRNYWMSQRGGATNGRNGARVEDSPSPLSSQRTGVANNGGIGITSTSQGGVMTGSGVSNGAPSGFDKWWNKAVHDGLIAGTGLRPRTVTARNSFPAATPAPTGIEITLRTDPSLWDGRFANNAWLQELPAPLTKLVWDNAAHMSPAMAKKNDDLHNGDLIALKTPNGSLVMPVLIVPGHADESITVHLGYGRTLGGQVAAGEEGQGAGFNTYTIRTMKAMSITSGEISRAGGSYQLVTTQEHHLIDPSLPQKPGQVDTFADRKDDILKSANLSEYKSGEFPHGAHHRPPSMYPPMWPSDISTQNQWADVPGMGPTGYETKGVGDSHGKSTTHNSAAPHSAPNVTGGHGAQGDQKHHAEKGGAGGRTLQDVPADSKDGIDRSHSQKPSVVPQDSIQGKWKKAENYAQHQWGMSIDLNTCIGCNACTIACQAENNIATVGKTMVGMSREMHWLRIDTYYKGSAENPTPYFQPMLCQHCEKAPCEPVCPVEATSHSAEGINEMTYNRCIGTKYCSNNCPYKVRRFNFLQFADQQTPTIQMMRNPDVTVRSRGVMEKCTFCVQRVNQARIQAEREERAIKDGEVLTACQQACPTNTIVFGNLIDKNSKVRNLRHNDLAFAVLPELSTHPRVTYLAEIRNPNPALEPEKAHEAEESHSPAHEGAAG